MSISEQITLLSRCIDEGLDLEEQLESKGLTYDDLRYRNSEIQADLFDSAVGSEWSPIHLAEVGPSRDIPTVSFFAGCGGLDLGFLRAGYRNLAAIEINETFCQTLRGSGCAGRVIGPPDYSGDARMREELVAILEGEVGLSPGGFPGVFHGGPPCQSFSIAANQRFAKNGDNFKRNGFANADYGTLLLDYVYYIKVFRPEVFLIENVAGLLTVDDGEQLTDAILKLQSAGYSVSRPTVLNAAEHGVPQTRHRAFIVGHRQPGKTFSFPLPLANKVKCGAVLGTPLTGVSNHITRKHRAESILRYMELSFGERDDLGRVDRLDPRMPSKTVIAGGTKGGGRSHLHPFIPRTLSVRESARLQTFPDWLVFHGPPARQFTQVGNAVPPLLAYRMARAIYDQLFR